MIRTGRKGERTRIRANRTAQPQSHTSERRCVVKSQAELVRLLSRWCVYFRALRCFSCGGVRNKGPLAGVHAVEPCRRAHYQQLTKTERFASHRSSIPFPHSPLHFRVVIAPLVWLCQIHVFPLPPKSCRKRSRNGRSASPSTLICPVKRLCVSRGSAFHGKFPETS